MDKEITFYGAVIDDNSIPLSDVELKIWIKKHPYTEEISHPKWATTDKNGLFEISGHGSSLWVEKAFKYGYEYEYHRNPKAFYFHEGESNYYVPNKSNPVIFVMRKKDPANIIIKDSTGMQFTEDYPQQKTITLLRKKWINQYGILHDGTTLQEYLDGKEIQLKYGKEHQDIEITVSLEDNVFYVQLKALDKNSGFAPIDKYQYHPLNAEYKKSKLYEIKNNSSDSRYLCFKGRSGSLYSKMQIFIGRTNEMITINIEYITNPEGRPNFDEDWIYQYAVKRYRDKVKKEREQIKSQARRSKKEITEQEVLEKISTITQRKEEIIQEHIDQNIAKQKARRNQK